MTTVKPEPTREDVNWRIERFRELGFARRQAEELEFYGVDWHEADRVLKTGCPHRLAMKILK